MKRTDAVKISIPGDRFTPFSLAKKLGALAVLESASFAHGKDCWMRPFELFKMIWV